MKQFEKFFSHACMYTVPITMAFYLFSNMVNEKGLSMTFARFFTIFAFSLLISSMEYIFSVTSIPKPVQYLLHYLVLCIAFNVVFFTIRKTASDFVFSAATVFSAVVLFSFAYGIFFLAVFLLRKATDKIKPKSKKNSPKTSEYKSRFK